MKALYAALLAGALLVPAMQARAADDIAAGKAKATLCAACHGANGISTAEMYPNLAGQKKAYLITQLMAFRDGSRVNAIMQPMAQPLTDQDINDLAAYFSSLKCGK